MFNLISRTPIFLSLSLVFLFAYNMAAQKAGLEVTRCSAVDRVLTLKNVAIDASGRRWAANSSGVFQVKAADLSTPLKIQAGENNVLAFPGGNADFAWSEAAFRNGVKELCSITAAWYDTKNQQLYLGTDEAGLIRFNTQPEFKFDVQWKTVNSKLKSNNITTLFQDASGKLWVGTDKGVMSGKPGLWKGDLAGTRVQRIREYNTVIYVLADGFISKAPGGEKWTDLALDEKYLEGDINDFDIDPSGKMWLVSGNLTRYDLLAGTYDEFGGPEYYTSQYGNMIAVEADGVAWVGTEDKGLFMVAKAYSMVLNAYVDKPISCEGNGKDAALMAKITGGEEPYNWVWTGGLSGENPVNVAPGVYSVTVTDVKGKARIAEVKVPDPRLKVNVKQKKPISAPGMADGVGEVDLPTNAAGITVQWDNGELLATATKLNAGEHSVTVADAKGCTVILKVMISEVAQPVSASISEKVKVKCAGGNGTLMVDVKGGKKPFTYKWSNPNLKNESPDNVPAGEYSVTVTDATNATSTASISVKQPDALNVSVMVQSPASVAGSDGKALAQVKGGTGVPFFKWDNGETVFVATKLPAGNRVLTVTDGNGCTATANFVIPENVLNLTVSVTETGKIKCAGDKSALLVDAKGGKGNFKYAWNNPAISGKEPSAVPAGDYVVTVTDGAGSTQTASIKVKAPQLLTASAIAQGVVSPGGADGKALCMTAGGALLGPSFLWDNGEVTAATLRLTAGLHYVTVTDENGCTAIASVMMTETVIPLEVSVSEKTPIKCSGDKAALVVKVSGGKANYKYAWSNPTLVGEAPMAAAGDYVLTVTDAAGVTKTTAVKVVAPVPLSLIVEAQGVLSPGKSDGKAIAKPVGGTASFSFQWENGETTNAASRLAPGISKVTVTDANGCKASASVTMSETFLPLAISVSEKTRIKCSGEKATLEVQVSGGKPSFKYAWSNTALTGAEPTAAPGNYILTVSDATGATITASVSVQSPAPLVLSVEVQTPLSPGKSDGKALAKPSGGTSPFNFIWDNGERSSETTSLAAGVSKVTVTDANGCTATGTVTMSETFLPLTVSIAEKIKIRCSGEKAALEVQVSGGKAKYSYAWNDPALTGESPSVLKGKYALTVTDAIGATKTASINVESPTLFAGKLELQSPPSPGAADGKILVTPNGGGTPPYTYVWENGETTLLATKIAAGAAKVTLTDANGCTMIAAMNVDETFSPLAVSISEKKPIQCFGEKAELEVQVTGGKSKYAYVWSNPSLTGAAPTVGAGDYSLTITDANGATKTASIKVKTPTALGLSVEMQSPASTGNADGKALAKPTGGAGSYIFQWESGESSNSALRLAPGNPKVTVTDANGCTAIGSVVITESILPLALTLTEKTPIKCGGKDKASLSLNISGGKRAYTIVWNNPAISGDAPEGLLAGDYAVTVTDAKGSTQSAKITVKAPEPMVIELTKNIGATSATNADGKAQVAVKGGTAPYKIAWDTRQTSLVASKLPSGLHSVTVTDAVGCTQTLEVETGRRAMPELTKAIEQGQTIPMRLLTFATDSASLRPAVYTYLDELYDFLVENPTVTIEVGGHTNNQPKDDFADYLSTERAKAVANYLIEKGVDIKRVQYKGYGKKQPLVPNTTPEGRKTNQRVEIKILTAGK
jgi:outer membrane protein OmpA-like peptidoglycan-associated protein